MDCNKFVVTELDFFLLAPTLILLRRLNAWTLSSLKVYRVLLWSDFVFGRVFSTSTIASTVRWRSCFSTRLEYESNST